MFKEIMIDIKLRWKIFKLNNVIRKVERELDHSN